VYSALSRPSVASGIGPPKVECVEVSLAVVADDTAVGARIETVRTTEGSPSGARQKYSRARR
jgi:hypothetical protein